MAYFLRNVSVSFNFIVSLQFESKLSPKYAETTKDSENAEYYSFNLNPDSNEDEIDDPNVKKAFDCIKQIGMDIDFIMDPIEKEYLKQICLSIHHKDELLEAFMFNLSYPKKGMSIHPIC